MPRPALKYIIWVAVLVSLAISLFLVVVYPSHRANGWQGTLISFFFNALVGMMYFLMLWWLTNRLDKHYSWLHHTGKRMLFQFLGLIVVVYINATLANLLYGCLIYGKSISLVMSQIQFRDYINQSYIPIIVTMFLVSKDFLKEWRESLLHAERLRYNNLQTRHAYLQNQIKPHFLFNSLNVLATLVHKDADQAEQFIHELSRLYRRLLEVDQQEAVRLSAEMEAFESYLFLVKMRFGASLVVSIGAYERYQNQQIPPFTLQLLLENVVKHNEMSRDRPVQVWLEFSEDWVVMRNTLSRKAAPVESSTGIGLKNLYERYALLGTVTPEIEEKENFFSVNIPLLSAKTTLPQS
ncbi:MAG: histidine kinase [Chitinophagales bacterium]|nr:histidine kinase [Chitinophagales bacterium]